MEWHPSFIKEEVAAFRKLYEITGNISLLYSFDGKMRAFIKAYELFGQDERDATKELKRIREELAPHREKYDALNVIVQEAKKEADTYASKKVSANYHLLTPSNSKRDKA